MRKGSAGYSAFRQARRLRRAHTLAASKWAGWATLAGASAGTLALGGPSVGSLAAGGAAGVAVAVWRLRRPGEWRRWVQGAKAEQRTGRILRPLARKGWVILHDLSIPKSNANLDHVAVHPSGRFAVYIDTKAWHARGARIYFDGRRLMYGRWNQNGKRETVEWEASRLQEETATFVVPVIAVDGGKVAGPNGARVININGTHVVQSVDLAGLLDRMTESLTDVSPARVNQVKSAIERKFPAAQ